MPQDGVATTMATPEILPVWRHMDDVLIANMAVRVAISTRMPSKGDGYEIWGSKPKKYMAGAAAAIPPQRRRGRQRKRQRGGVATTMATPEILPVWRHMDDVLIAIWQ